mgnify:CR=1 FL=1
MPPTEFSAALNPAGDIASAVFVMQRQWPAAVRRVRVALAVRLLRESQIKTLLFMEPDLEQLKGIRRDVLALLQDARQGRVDVVRTAAQWSRDDLGLRLRCIENCLTASVVHTPAMRPEAPEMRAGAQLQSGALDINIRSALGLVDGVRELQRQLGTSLNKTLALERYFWQLNSG